MADAKPVQKIFVRESTGLVKNVSLLDAVSLNLGSMGVGLSLASIGYTMYLLPSVSGLNMIVASIIALLLVVPQIIVYQSFISRIARTGGDYIWVSRSVGGALGSVVAFAGIIMIQLAYAALTIMSTIFAIGAVGLYVSPSSTTALGLALPSYISGSEPSLQFAVGATLFVVIIALNILRPKAGYLLVSACVVIGVILLVLATGVILAKGQTGIARYIDSLGAVNPNNSSISFKSLSAGNGGGFSLTNTLGFMPFFIFFTYPWFATAAPAVGSEFKGSQVARRNIILAVIISFVFATVPIAVMYYVGGFAFTNNAFSNATLVINYTFNFWTLAMGISGNTILGVVIGLGWILWNVALLGYLVITFSRFILALAFDRFLPAKFADVTPRFSSPWVAHLLDLFVTLAVTGFAAFLYGTVSSLYGIAMNNWIWFILVGIAAIVYGLRKIQGRGKVLMAVSGGLMSLVYIYISIIFLQNPHIWGGNYLAYGYDVSVFIAGAIIYAASKIYRKKVQGLDIELAYKEIPPE
jgi:amino acid transporter